ncbi:CBS domain-containing protein [Amorphus coralli]|uniref:CBS domain-containing protein n=1 Tax=Amorphus coralli TaxID=340680 RepID=UPI00036A11CF|nr:CBS domain-containing protein [Amorphus coralli]
MKISEIMNQSCSVASTNETIETVARRMVDEDLGFLPVSQQDKLVGSITDRDIVSRVVAEGRGLSCTVADIMTQDVKYCFEEDDVEQVMANMANNGVRRMPVVNSEKRLVGVVSVMDAASAGRDQAASHALGALGAEKPSQAA